jgi:hypothetical protein
MSLPIFFPPSEIAAILPPGKPTTLRKLCQIAGIDCRVTGLSARRRLRLGDAAPMKAIRLPGALGPVWLGISKKEKPARRALLALGLLAFSVFDYGARECLRGLDEANASPGRGRPRKLRPLTLAERQRRWRQKNAA